MTVHISQWGLKMLRFQVGDDLGGIGKNDFVIEKIGEPFIDGEGEQMVPLVLVERSPKIM